MEESLRDRVYTLGSLIDPMTAELDSLTFELNKQVARLTNNRVEVIGRQVPPQNDGTARLPILEYEVSTSCRVESKPVQIKLFTISVTPIAWGSGQYPKSLFTEFQHCLANNKELLARQLDYFLRVGDPNDGNEEGNVFLRSAEPSVEGPK